MFGQLLKNNPLMTYIFVGRINGPKSRCRPRNACLEEMMRPSYFNQYVDITRLAFY